MAIKDLVPRIGRGREHVPARRGDYDPFRGFQLQMNRLFDDFFGAFPLAHRWGEWSLEEMGSVPASTCRRPTRK